MLLAQLQVVEAFEVPESACIISEAISSSLSATERRIVNLTQQLRSEIDVYMQKITSIHAVHATAPPAQETGRFKTKLQALSPISRCPDVLLEEIFELVAENGSHAMLPLLTVNKQFYRVVISNPVLWRKIFIEMDEDIEEVNSLSGAYIEICVGRSRDVLLDVILDCSAIPDPHSFMHHYIRNLIYHSEKDELGARDATDYLFFELEEPEVDRPRDYWEFPLYSRKLKYLLDITKSLVGLEETNARRWRSATIRFPDTSSVTKALWYLISSEMPNLQSLRLNCVDYSALRKILPSQSRPVLTQFAISKSIDLSQVPIDFEFLTTLEFAHSNFKENTSLVTLSRCIALQELTITCWGDCDDDDGEQPGVELPMLVSLSLRRNVSILRHVRFHLPRLENWYLDCFSTENLPDINAPYIRWKVRLHAYQEEMERPIELISRLKVTKLVLDGLLHPEASFARIREMKSTLPRSLKVVEIVGGGSLDLTSED
ncbi:hypothetical protein FRC17_004369 [Serendipita sp. 399]|nr:hypothetical protein FRC17_004369 [Serendipita sp. 399]